MTSPQDLQRFLAVRECAVINFLETSSLREPIAAALIALMTSVLLGPLVIRGLRLKCRERIASDSERLNQLHASKQNTPTMGGLLIMLSLLAGAAFFVEWNSLFVWLVVVFALALSAVGACDDWIKLRTTKQGLTIRQKLAAQTVIAVLASTGLFLLHDQSAGLASVSYWLPGSLQWLMIPWGTVVIVATSNAVNLTDGLDGLAAGCTVISGTAITLIIAGLMTSAEASSVLQNSAVLSAAMAGAAAGFLCYNRHPARVFMGDTGALPIGGMLALISLACRIELTLILTGAVFVVESASVIAQVVWFRRTRKRILLCSPLHNHFVFRRVAEVRIVTAFWIAAGACAVVVVFLCRS